MIPIARSHAEAIMSQTCFGHETGHRTPSNAPIPLMSKVIFRLAPVATNIADMEKPLVFYAQDIGMAITTARVDDTDHSRAIPHAFKWLSQGIANMPRRVQEHLAPAEICE